MLVRGIKYFLLLFVVIVIPVFAQTVEEYRAKAAYVERITRFISWPSGHVPADPEYFVIAVAGQNPFDGKLKSYLKNQRINNKPVRIILIDNPSDLSKCDMAFIAGSEENSLKRYIRLASKHKVLLISDKEEFAVTGVHFNLIAAGDRIKILINYDSILADGFTVESLLLDYSELISNRKEEN